MGIDLSLHYFFYQLQFSARVVVGAAYQNSTSLFLRYCGVNWM